MKEEKEGESIECRGERERGKEEEKREEEEKKEVEGKKMEEKEVAEEEEDEMERAEEKWIERSERGDMGHLHNLQKSNVIMEFPSI